MGRMTGMTLSLATAALLWGCGGDDPQVVDVGGTGGTVEGSGGDGSGEGGAAALGSDADFVTEGLGEAGAWKGYLFTAVDELGTTISPTEFSGSNLCVSGEVALDAAYESWAMVGWNINQEIEEDGGGGAVMAIAPGGSGVEVTVENPGATTLRVQIQEDDTGAGDSWCADLPPGGSGTILWEEFRQECWTSGGDVYDPATPIAQVAVQVPAGSNTSTTPFEFCVVHLGPAE